MTSARHALVTGAIRLMVSFGTERVMEEATVQAFFAPGDALLFYVDGVTPASLELIMRGTLVGGLLTLEIPLIETVPGALDTSITSLTLTLGAVRQEGSTNLYSLTMPAQCPSGQFAWAAEVVFLDHSIGHATAETACPERAGSEATVTTLQVSTPSPAVNETVRYTAAVVPQAPGAIAPSGSVEFLDDNVPIQGCTAQPLTQSGQSPTATCQVEYSVPGGHSIMASYGGAPNVAGSSSGSTTVTVHATLAQLAHMLGVQLVPSGKAARIATLLRTGSFTMPFGAIEGGTVVIDWLQRPVRAGHARRTAHKQTLLATGKTVFSVAGTREIKIKLTRAGRRLLRKSRRLKLMGQGTFTPAGGSPVSVNRPFVLRR